MTDPMVVDPERLEALRAAAEVHAGLIGEIPVYIHPEDTLDELAADGRSARWMEWERAHGHAAEDLAVRFDFDVALFSAAVPAETVVHTPDDQAGAILQRGLSHAHSAQDPTLGARVLATWAVFSGLSETADMARSYSPRQARVAADMLDEVRRDDFFRERYGPMRSDADAIAVLDEFAQRACGLG